MIKLLRRIPWILSFKVNIIAKKYWAVWIKCCNYSIVVIAFKVTERFI
jgi:hypothetical protein